MPHWVYLLERPRQSELAADGHPVGGIPAPPGPGLRRMFAGGRLRVTAPLRFDAVTTRATSLVGTVSKVGRSGPLTFLTVRHEISQEGRVAVVDEQDLVYRPAGATGPGAAAPPATPGGNDPGDGEDGDPALRLALAVDEVLLFRFSALTYNAHRIHYDRDYAASEGYPDLVVHGPLQALLMAEALRLGGVELTGREFRCRMLAPTFGAQRLGVAGRSTTGASVTWVHDAAGIRTAGGRCA